MVKQIILAILVVSNVALVKGQGINRKEADSLLRSIKSGRKDIVQLNQLLKLAEFNILKPGELKADLDSAANFLKQAHQLNLTLKSPEANGYLKLVDAYLNDEKLDSRQLFIEAEAALRPTNDLYHLAIAKAEVSRYYNANIPSEAAAKTELLNSAGELLKKAGTDPNVVFQGLLVRKEIAEMHSQQGKNKLAVDEFTRLIEDYKKKGAPRIFEVYDLLGVAHGNQQNYAKSIFCYLEAVKSVKTAQDSGYIYLYYYRLAYTYLLLNKQEQARQWFQKYIDYYIAHKDKANTYATLPRIAECYTNEKRPADALKYILRVQKKLPPETYDQQKSLAASLARAYEGLRRLDLAEKYYLKMIRFSDLQVAKGELAADPVVNAQIGWFYINHEKGGFKKAKLYLKKAMDAWSPGLIKTLWALNANFKLDSAAGNYISAIRQLQQLQKFKDSTFNETKSKQIEELSIAYETEQKKQEVKLLEEKEKIQRMNLQHAENRQKWILAGSMMLLLLLGVIYNRFRLKQKSNQVIMQKNLLLQHLLTEKEWLLKEVHHRVKNNLHTVICLLESQARYLENDALKAIESSQHRIYAMSLIHQKLYQSENVKTIDMSLYLPEFAKYLNDSFGTERQIRFQMDIDPLMLGVSQAIPIALIVNEAITNSIKYAFPGGSMGVIGISMHKIQQEIVLVVTDNGIGIDPVIANTPQESLGLKLMKGLSEDLHGSITIESDHGTKITILFKVGPLNEGNDLITKIQEREIFS